MIPISEATHQLKYRSAGESFRESMNRIASVLGDDEEHFQKFRSIITR